MNTLPLELLHEIFTHLPKSSLSTTRLVSQTWENLSFPLLFSHIPNWLDYNKSHQAITQLANDAFNRPAVMWSPWALGEDKKCDFIWLGLVWRVLMGGKFDGKVVGAFGREGDREPDGRVLTAENFAALSGREEMTERILRMGMNRFTLHRRYAGKCCFDVVEKKEKGEEEIQAEVCEFDILARL